MLGLSPDQNATTLNGMNFGGSNLPRDANVSTSLVTSPYDVSRGNFSGGLLNVRSRPGSNYMIRTSSFNFDAPQMQWTDPAGRQLGQQYHNLSVGGLFSGPIQTDKSFFSVAYQAGRRSSDLQSLLNTDALGLRAVGVSEDSVQNLLSILGRDNVPPTIGGIPGARLSDNALVFGTLDLAPPSSTTGQAFNVTFNGSWNRQDPSGLSSTELPSHGGERANWYGGVQAKHSGYFGFGVLSETPIGVNRMRFYGNPFVDLPNGSVRVNSTFADGTSGVQNLAFGGNPAMNINMTTTTAQAMNTLSWFSENNKHRLKLTTELRRDQYAQDLSDQRARNVQLQFARRSRRRPAGVVHAAAHAARAERRAVRRRHVVGRFLPADGRFPDSVRRAPRRQSLRERTRVQSGRRAGVRPSQRLRAEQDLREPARRLLVDVRDRDRRSPRSRARFAGRAR